MRNAFPLFSSLFCVCARSACGSNGKADLVRWENAQLFVVHDVVSRQRGQWGTGMELVATGIEPLFFRRDCADWLLCMHQG
jgi:hypothetical protein